MFEIRLSSICHTKYRLQENSGKPEANHIQLISNFFFHMLYLKSILLSVFVFHLFEICVCVDFFLFLLNKFHWWNGIDVRWIAFKSIFKLWGQSKQFYKRFMLVFMCFSMVIVYQCCIYAIQSDRRSKKQ